MIVSEDKGTTEVMLEAEVEAEAIVLIMEIVNNVNTIIIKAEERGRVATTQSHVTSLKLNVTDATNSVITNQLGGEESNFAQTKEEEEVSLMMAFQRESFH
ncbi:hypothetical protein KY285_005115 [Solanum tuberosum]|nr:hypothetical protein KY284_005340 [Solanum tuberosum]KAH0751967.1 hypothetical protein KY285_005115 [Solanum tuberosum]